MYNQDISNISDYNHLISKAGLLKQGVIATGEMYTANLNTKTDFIFVRRKGGSYSPKKGLKFHVSVDPNRINDAWKIIAEVMDKHKVGEAKFANPYYKDEFDGQQEPGREITLYAFNERGRRLYKSHTESDLITGKEDLNMKLSSWEEIICDITKRLQEEGIQPGPAPEGNSEGGGYERQMPGTKYVTWRHDDLTMGDFKIKDEFKELHIPSNISNEELDNKYIEIVNVDEVNQFSLELYRNLLRGFGHLSEELMIDLGDNKHLDRLVEGEHVNRRENNYVIIRNNENNQNYETNRTKYNQNNIETNESEQNTNNNISIQNNSNHTPLKTNKSFFREGHGGVYYGNSPLVQNNTNNRESEHNTNNPGSLQQESDNPPPPPPRNTKPNSKLYSQNNTNNRESEQNTNNIGNIQQESDNPPPPPPRNTKPNSKLYLESHPTNDDLRNKNIQKLNEELREKLKNKNNQIKDYQQTTQTNTTNPNDGTTIKHKNS